MEVEEVEERIRETLVFLHTASTLIQSPKIILDHKASHLYLLGIYL